MVECDHRIIADLLEELAGSDVCRMHYNDRGKPATYPVVEYLRRYQPVFRGKSLRSLEYHAARMIVQAIDNWIAEQRTQTAKGREK